MRTGVAGAIDQARLLDLAATATPDVCARLDASLNWLNNIEWYAPVQRRTAAEIPETKVPSERLDLLIQAGVLEEIDAKDVRGGMRVFGVHEHIGEPKERWRIIKWTVDANDALPKETCPAVDFPSKQKICNLVVEGDYAAQFDFAAFFD